jgi:hypothetical protein
MATNYKNMEKENLVLREYIIQLQSRLLEAGHRDLPPAPAELTKQTVAASSSIVLPTPSAVADLHRMEAQLQDGGDDDVSPDDEMDSLGAQLQVAAAAAARQIGNDVGAGEQDIKDDVGGVR